MAAPRNNLDELRRQQSGGKSTVTAPVGQTSNGAPKTFKFKPAGGNATPGNSGPLTEPSFMTRKFQKTNSDGPSRIKRGSLVAALTKAQPSVPTNSDTSHSVASSTRRPKRASSDNQHVYTSGTSPKRTKLDIDEPLRNGVQDVDMALSAAEDEEEMMWNEMHASSSAPAVVEAAAPPPSRRDSLVSHHRPQQPSRHATPSTSQYRPSVLRPFVSSQGNSQTGTPFSAPVSLGAPIPPPPDVPPDLQVKPIEELQRLLMSNYKQMIQTMGDIIDDPSKDRFILDITRTALTKRIGELESAVSWKAHFEGPTAPSLLSNVSGSGTGALGLQTGLPAPMTPSTPGSFTNGAVKREPKLEPFVNNSQSLLSSPSRVHTPTRERIYPRLPNEVPRSPSPRRGPASGSINAAPLADTTFGSRLYSNTKVESDEVFDLESDSDSDIVEITDAAPPKPPPVAEPSMTDIPDANVTRRSPRKLKGIDAMPLPGPSDYISSSASEENSLETAGASMSTAATSIAPPPTEFATVSRHFAPLGPTESMISDKDRIFDELDSEFNIAQNIESEESASIYKDEIMDKLHSVFGLQSFRTNQAAAVDATMEGKDVFVLMPTGGGKSLCYQLPAVCTTGRTRGVTFVVSPLKSLMEDQVRGLRAKNIDVVMFSSDQSVAAGREARSRLTGKVAQKPALAYVTPEKLEKSEDMQNILDTLYRQGLLARFVIDEAHCVSTWGRDFRDAYQGLDILRKRFPDVPIMALTATANSKVRKDIITKLGIVGCDELVSSFNRPNLHYEVRKKAKNVVADIANYIHAHHHNQAGVIYCLSRNKCEEVAKQLRDNYRITARHYHAGMTPKDKNETQAAWSSGECNVIVATIAFGMGIDKADVRFVIHHQIPMSMSGYYQETGRAGRDGKASQPAQCVLFYNFGDKGFMDRMIEQGGTKEGRQPPSKEEQQRQKDDLRQVVQFCQNITDCRRTQILAYFSEQFDSRHCYKTCDNCVNHVDGVEPEDMSDVARMALELVESGAYARVTMNNLIDAFKGSKNKAVNDKRLNELPMYGKGAHLAKELVERIFHHLAAADALKEELYTNSLGFSNPYIVLGDAAKDYIEGRKRFLIVVGPKDKDKGKGKPINKAFTAAANKLKAPVPVKHTVKRKESKSIRSINRDEDEKDPLELEEPAKASSPPPIPDQIEDDEDDIVPSNFFDDPEQIETQPEEVPPALQTNNRAPSRAPQATAQEPDVEEDPAVDGFTGLFNSLQALRVKMVEQFGLNDADDVFQEEVLQELAFLKCNSEEEFKKALKSALGPNVNFEEKFAMFGQPFMELCLKAAGQSSQIKIPKISELHNQYDFKGTPSKRAGGFKPAPSRAGSRKV